MKAEAISSKSRLRCQTNSVYWLQWVKSRRLGLGPSLPWVLAKRFKSAAGLYSALLRKTSSVANRHRYRLFRAATGCFRN